MASRKRLISRSVACSLAALLLLSGCMFMVSTFQSDSEEWVLVEDEQLDLISVNSSLTAYVNGTDSSEAAMVFDEDTSTYAVDITGGTRAASGTDTKVFLSVLDAFDFSKNYKIAIVSEGQSFVDFGYVAGSDAEVLFNLKTVAADDDTGAYTASVVLLDQHITDLEYKDGFYFTTRASSSSATFEANTISIQLYELQTDNTGSIAAGITGLIMIVCGVFAMPMHNILRRR